MLNGKIIGLFVCFAISCMISFVKVFGTVEVPTKIVGFIALTAASKFISSSEFSNSSRFLAKGICSGVNPSVSSNNNPCLSTK